MAFDSKDLRALLGGERLTEREMTLLALVSDVRAEMQHTRDELQHTREELQKMATSQQHAEEQRATMATAIAGIQASIAPMVKFMHEKDGAQWAAAASGKVFLVLVAAIGAFVGALKFFSINFPTPKP
jgi:hypothetical protein